MPKILILGINGQLARTTTPFFLKHQDVHLTLYLPRANQLKNPNPGRVTIVEGDILNIETLSAAMQGQDVVYANLAGAIEEQTKTIMKAIQVTGLKRLIFINSPGVFREAPGERFQSILDPYGMLLL